MPALALEIRHIPHGWAVYATNGQLLARFRGWGAQRRALDFVRRWAR